MNPPSPDIKHGTWSGSRRHGCRCTTCRAYQSKSSNLSRLRRLRGEPTYLSRQDVRDHVATLIQSGMTLVDIATAADVTPSSLRETLRHQRDRMRATYARRILNVQPHVRPDSVAQISALGAQRRLRALARMGYNLKYIANNSGLSYVTLTNVRTGTHDTVAAHVHYRLANWYEQHHMTRGPSDKAAANAARQRWLPPLAWDDIDNDTADDAWTNVGRNPSRIRAL